MATPIPEDGYHGDYVADACTSHSGRASGRGRPANPARTRSGQRAAGRRSGSGPASRPHWRRWACTSTSGRARRSLHDGGLGRAGDRAPARMPGTCTSRTAPCGSARPRSATTRIVSIIRSNGEPTYFAADIGYVTEKFSRGFDHLIYIWGADHHGTVARVRNAAEAMGYDQARGPDAPHSAGSGSSATASRSRCPSGPATS